VTVKRLNAAMIAIARLTFADMAGDPRRRAVNYLGAIVIRYFPRATL
jgi:hypothetical protein